MRALRYTTDRSPKPRLTHPNQLGSRGSPLGRVLAGFVLASLALVVFPGNAQANICTRTAAVQTAILAEITGVSNCANVTSTHLASITGPLSLSSQSITSLQAGDFANLSSLTNLNLGANNLRSLPTGVFSGLSSLTTLYLNHNNLTLSTGVFSGLSSLTNLYLRANNLRSLSTGVFSGLSSLTMLDLAHNNMSSLSTGVFSGLSSLTNLDLRANNMSSLSTGVFSGLSSLTMLYLNQNNLSSLPTGVFSGLSSLTTLYLDHNNVRSLSTGVFSGLSSLTNLYLRANTLSSLSTGVFSNLSSLTNLNLRGNNLSSLPTGVFSNLSSLTNLNLGTNYLSSLPDGVFSNLSSLTNLNLGVNDLRSLPDGVFSNLSSLTNLYLGANDLSSLPDGVFSGLSSLTNLDLEANDLSSLPDGVFSGLSSLTNLNLGVNDLSSLPDGVFSGLSSLTNLDLRANDLSSLPDGVFSGLSSLTHLNLGVNDLRSLPDGVFSGLSSLTMLYLDHNNLSSLPTGVFSGLSSLTTLTLYDNGLSSLSTGVFSGLSSLTNLHLEANDLSSLPDGVFSGLSSLTGLRLDGNSGAPFTFTMEPERTGTNRFVVKVREGAPFTMTTDLTVSGGTLSATSVRVAAGSTSSTSITATPTGTGPVVVTLGDPPSLPSLFYGLETAVGSQLTLTHAIQPRFQRLNNEILSKHALSIADVTIAAVTSRQEAGPRCAGQATTGSLGGQSSLAEILTANAQTLNTGSLNLKQLLGTSAFRLRLTEDGSGAGPGCLTLWGQGDYRNLSSSDAQALDWDGDLLTGQVGADALLRPDLRAGLAVSWSDGAFDYTDRTEGEPFSGDYSSRMVSVHPYVTWWTPMGLDVWATGGYGQGKIEIEDEQAGTHTSDTTLRLGSVGASGPLPIGNALIAGGTTTLRLKAQASVAQMEVEGNGPLLQEQTIDAQRLRLALEGSHERPLASGGSLTPSLEVGLRHDGGDGATGTGLELGGGLRYVDPALGLTLEGRGRVLAAYDEAYEEWGASGLIRLDPGAAGQGLSLSLAPSYGQTASGVQRLWDQGLPQGPTQGPSPTQALTGRLEAEVGYGLTAFAGQGLVTPYGQLSLGGGTQQYRVGSRLELGPGLRLSLEGTRQVTALGQANHGIRLQVGWRF